MSKTGLGGSMSPAIKVPPTWQMFRVECMGFDLLDLFHVGGRRISYQTWRDRRYPNLTDRAAERRWQRFKTDLKSIGVEFDLDAEWEAEECIRHTLVFKSYDYARDIVDQLLGPADPLQPKGTPTKCLEDFFPDEDPADVRALFDALAEETLRE